MVASTGWATLHSQLVTEISDRRRLCGKSVEATFLASKILKLAYSKVKTQKIVGGSTPGSPLKRRGGGTVVKPWALPLALFL